MIVIAEILVTGSPKEIKRERERGSFIGRNEALTIELIGEKGGI